MSKLAFVLCFNVYVAAEGGAIFEMKGPEPKIVFGELANPVCELKLDRANARLESTCDIFSAENEVLKATVATLETKVAEHETWKTDIVAQMEHVLKTIAVITPPPSLPPSVPPSLPPNLPPCGGMQVHTIRGTNFSAYTELAEDGLCWTLIFAYRRLGGENNALVPEVLPISPTNGYSHASLSDYGVLASDIDATRLYCNTSHHERIIHFKTSNSRVIQRVLADNGDTSASDWNTNFVAYSDHSAYLPAATMTTNSASMSFFPFYKPGSYHWGVNAVGPGRRWECDDEASNNNYETLHQVWVHLPNATVTALPPPSLLFGDGKGLILSASRTYGPDVNPASPDCSNCYGDVQCVRNTTGCVWSSSSSSAYVEVRLDQPATIHEIVWNGFGFNSVSFSYKASASDSSWSALGESLLNTAETMSYLPPYVGPISDVRFQMTGSNWDKVRYLRIFGYSFGPRSPPALLG